MKLYTYKTTEIIPCSLDEAWDFFSDPRNLRIITPEKMDFRIVTEEEFSTYSGQIIAYTVKPLPLFRTLWVTEIKNVTEKQFFIDEQRFGPYKFWHHKHHFRETAEGVEMTDVVHYALPFGWLGRLALPLVRAKLAGIFNYRAEKIRSIFPPS